MVFSMKKAKNETIKTIFNTNTKTFRHLRFCNMSKRSASSASVDQQPALKKRQLAAFAEFVAKEQVKQRKSGATVNTARFYQDVAEKWAEQQDQDAIQSAAEESEPDVAPVRVDLEQASPGARFGAALWVVLWILARARPSLSIAVLWMFSRARQSLSIAVPRLLISARGAGREEAC